jgi:hypothetical protein
VEYCCGNQHTTDESITHTSTLLQWHGARAQGDSDTTAYLIMVAAQASKRLLPRCVNDRLVFMRSMRANAQAANLAQQ